jgi:acyl dehydratase
VAINPDYQGRSFPPGAPYEVSRVKIAEFAEAIGDANPLYTDADAARAAGYPDVIAPPTFPVVISVVASRATRSDPGLGLNYAMVVHGEQKFSYSRPLHAGDVVSARTTITSIRRTGPLSMITSETEIHTMDGEHVCTTTDTLVERGA